MGGVDWLVIDYIQKVSPEKGRNEDRRAQMNLTNEILRQTVYGTDTALLTLSQINEKGAARESAQINDDAMISITLDRKKDDEGHFTDKIKLFTSKSRFTGPRIGYPEMDGESGAIGKIKDITDQKLPMNYKTGGIDD